MNNIKILLLLLSILAGCRNNSSNSNVGEATQNSPTPQSTVEMSPIGTYALPAALNYYGEVQMEHYDKPNFNLVSNFYPIGWSANSKFAYIREPAMEARDGAFYYLLIQDAVSDRELVNFEMTKVEGEEGFAQVWERNADTITYLLTEHQIEAMTPFTLYPHKFEAAGKSYELSMKVITKESEHFSVEVIESQMLWAKSSQLGRKLIYQDSNKEFSVLLNAEVAGHLKSPLGALIMAVIKEEDRGYEGPPHVLDFRLIGCHLENNFE